MLAEVETCRTDQVANVLDEHDIVLCQVEVMQCLVDHMRIEMTRASGRYLYCLDAMPADTLRIVLGLEVALERPEFTRHEGEIQVLGEPVSQAEHGLDQGATEAVALAELPDRGTVGKIEAQLRDEAGLADKTHWTRLLKNERAEGDLAAYADRVLAHLQDLGEDPDPLLARILDACLILHAEHTINASTFAALVAGSTLASPYLVIAAAVGTLAGPLHGGANQRVVEMLADIDKETVDFVPNYDESLMEPTVLPAKIPAAEVILVQIDASQVLLLIAGRRVELFPR